MTSNRSIREDRPPEGTGQVFLRPLEKDDLRFVHRLDNNSSVMHYWFEEPYEAYVELLDLYDKHIHNQNERRFIIEAGGVRVGLVELVEINYIHRRAEFQIVVDPEHEGQGYAKQATLLAMRYAFSTLNLFKLYLIVDVQNRKAIHIYEQMGFIKEGDLLKEFFVDGHYHDAIRMCTFQDQFFASAEHQRHDLAATASRAED